jgi:eukaryotic-like serine/threonine-protein kinase
VRPFRRRRNDPVPPDDVPARVDEAPPGAVAHEEVEEHVPVRRRSGWWDPYWPWLLLLLVLVLAGLGALWYFSQEDDKGVVPDVVGQTEAQAVEEVEDAGLDSIVRRRASPRPSSEVFATEPGAGTQLDEGEDVILLVSTGPATASVPNVVGLPLEDAEERLEEAGLRAEVRRVFSEEPVAVVVAQSPAAGERVEADAPVQINVSKGTGRVEVPDLVGLSEDEAKAELGDVGLQANVFEVPSDAPAGQVVAQNPPAGDEVGEGDTVRINVSNGEGGGTQTDTTQTDTTETTTGSGGADTVTVPAVVDQRLRSAQATLRDAGFAVLVDYVSSDRPRGVVVSQSPAGGASAREGATVTLRASRGPGARLRAVPDVVGLVGEQAEAELRRGGFDVELVMEPSPDPEEEGLVIRQAPAAGRRVPQGALVTIYVASG